MVDSPIGPLKRCCKREPAYKNTWYRSRWRSEDIGHPICVTFVSSSFLAVVRSQPYSLLATVALGLAPISKRCTWSHCDEEVVVLLRTKRGTKELTYRGSKRIQQCVEVLVHPLKFRSTRSWPADLIDVNHFERVGLGRLVDRRVVCPCDC